LLNIFGLSFGLSTEFYAEEIYPELAQDSLGQKGGRKQETIYFLGKNLSGKNLPLTTARIHHRTCASVNAAAILWLSGTASIA
jgi:hypothetical protein